MMTLVLLTACGGTAAGDPAEELALAVRGEYLAMERCAAEASGSMNFFCPPRWMGRRPS